MTHRKALAVILLAVALTFNLGCAAQHPATAATTPPPDARVVFANNLLSAAQATEVLSTSLVAADTFARNTRAAEPEYYNYLHPYLVKIAQANDKAIAAIRAAKAGDTTADWRAALLAIIDAAGSTDPAVFGFKNKNTQAAAAISLASLKLAVAGFAGFKGGQ